jgi:hypothetical protein
MATGFMILLLGTIINRIVILKRSNGVTTIQDELIGFSTYLVTSMAIWFTIMFVYTVIH